MAGFSLRFNPGVVKDGWPDVLMKPANRGPKLGTAALIVLALLLGSSFIFVGAVYRKAQANRAILVEFDGFINYGTPIRVEDQTVVVTESRVERPVFSTRANWPRLRFWYEEWAFATREVLADLAQLFRSEDKP